MVIFLGFTEGSRTCYNLDRPYQRKLFFIFQSRRFIRKSSLSPYYYTIKALPDLQEAKKKQLTIPENYTIIGYIGEHKFADGNSEIKGEEKWHRW